MSRFSGIYAKLLDQYIAFKRNLGFKYVDAEYTYAQFDRMTIERMEEEIGITKELAHDWAAKRPNESDSTCYRRVMYLIHFAVFLKDMGYASYIPPYPRDYKSTFTPYIYTIKEIHSIFWACDRLELGNHMDSTANVLPAMLRLMYGSGLRIGEAVALRVKDVNLADRFLTVTISKNGKERLVPFSATVAEALCQYQGSLSLRQEEGDHFFVKRNGRPCREKTVYEWFRKILHKAGISHGGRGKGPRLHDIRHSFSVHSMAAMAEAGLDLYYSLPILSEYLGHQSLEATDKYVRLTSELYPGLLHDAASICSYAFPEVYNHDSN